MARKIDVCLYAESGWGKTTAFFEWAENLWETEGKKTRLVTCSGGGWEVGQHLVDAGIVEVFFFEENFHPMQTTQRLCTGWWPKDSRDANSVLLPPPTLEGRWTNWKHGYQTQDQWSAVDLYGFESITEIASRVFRHLVAMGAKGTSISPDSEKNMVTFRDGDEWFGEPSRGVYGTVQNYMEQWIKSSKGLDKHVLWTALPRTAEDEEKTPIIGPEVVGKASTRKVPAWFSHCLHGDYREDKRVVFTRRHSTEYLEALAKTTVPLKFIDKMPNAYWSEGEGRGLVFYLNTLAAIRKLSTEETTKENKDAGSK